MLFRFSVRCRSRLYALAWSVVGIFVVCHRLGRPVGCDAVVVAPIYHTLSCLNTQWFLSVLAVAAVVVGEVGTLSTLSVTLQ